MKRDDVLSFLLADERLPDAQRVPPAVLNGAPPGHDFRGEVIAVLDAALAVVRPTTSKHAPLTHSEVQRLRLSLRLIGDAIGDAHARYPAPFALVEPSQSTLAHDLDHPLQVDNCEQCGAANWRECTCDPALSGGGE